QARAEDALAHAAQDAARVEQEQEAMRRERAALLDGQSVLQVEASLKREQEAARNVLAQAMRELRRTAENHARHGEALAQARQRIANLAATATATLQRLEDWLERFNDGRAENGPVLDRGQLDALLEHDTAWIAAERAR